MAIKNRHICDFVTQRCASLSSLVIHNNHKTTLGYMARIVVCRMLYSPVNSKDGIKLSLDTPLNNRPYLNILRPGVSCLYFGRNVIEYSGQNSFDSSGNDIIVKRYTHGSGSGISSVGMDPYKFVTQKK